MAAKPTMLTAEGLKNLEEELAELQNVKRKEIAEKIKVARSYGDLSENSEYDDAKIVLFGAPYDSTTSFRPGTRFAAL